MGNVNAACHGTAPAHATIPANLRGEAILHDFSNGPDGGIPQEGVTLRFGGTSAGIFGSTPSGGSGGNGVVYESFQNSPVVLSRTQDRIQERFANDDWVQSPDHPYA